MTAVVCVPFGAPADAELHRRVAALQGGDPLRPVTVAVPTGYARVLVRRRWPGGLCNVRFESLNRVAELLGAPFLGEPGRAPLDTAALREAVRSSLETGGEPRRVLDPHGTIADGRNRVGLDALCETVGELWGLPPERVAGPGAAPATRRALGGLCARVRDRLGDRYDDEAQLRAAAAQVRARPPSHLGPLVVYLPERLGAGAVALLEAWAATLGVTVLLGLSGEPDLDAATERAAAELADRLGVAVETVAVPEAPAATVRIAPDPDTEVRMVVADVLAAIGAGIPAWRMVITFPASHPYASLAARRCAEAGIPVAGPDPHPLADRTAGRFLLRALAATDPERPLARRAVVDCLAAAPVVVDGTPVGAAHAERCSAEQGIVAGLDGPQGWRAGLDRSRGRVDDAEADARDDHPDGDHDDPRRVALGRFVEALAATPADPGGRAPWPAWATWLRSMLDLVHLPADAEPHEHAARDAVGLALDRLAALGAPGAAVPHPAVADALAALLARGAGPRRPLERGVLVAPLPATLAGAWERAFVVGLAEGWFPPGPPAPGPLDDDTRAELGLPTRGDQAAEARRRLAALRRACAAITCSAPRSDPASGATLLPAPPLVALAAERDETLSATGLVRRDTRRHPSFSAWLLGTPDPLSPTDWEVRELAGSAPDLPARLDHRLVREIPELASAAECLRARWAPALGPFDGVIGALPGLAATRALHPSELAAWADCPFRYFLASVCGLRRRELPEEVLDLDPRVRGEVVHELLAEFLAERHPDPDRGWGPDDRRRLDELAAERFARAEAERPVGHRHWWAVTRRETLAELHATLERDAELRRELAEHPRYFEVSFGDGADATWPPLELAVEGAPGPLRFAGRIDRIDEGDDGRSATVYDYKTGRPPDRAVARDPLSHGLGLQLAVYALAARAHLPGRRVRAAYWYTGAPSGEELVEVPLEDGDTGAEALVRQVAEAILSGFFPAAPGEEQDWPRPGRCERCRFCDFDRVCPADRAQLAARKAADPGWAISPYHAPAPGGGDAREAS